MPPAAPIAASSPAWASDRRWPQVFARLALTEWSGRPGGGFTDALHDRGGATCYGLSLRYLAAESALSPELKAMLDADNNGSIDRVDVRELTLSKAEAVYFERMWNAPGFNLLPATFDQALFDQGVNAGCRAAVKLLQRALNVSLRPTTPELKVDGDLGERTKDRLGDAVHALKGPAVLDAYRAAAADRYQSIVKLDASQRKWLKGWLRRAEELGCV